jgi:hypothetical protein
MKLMILIGTTVFGWAGWWLGEQLSDDVTAALLLGGVGTVAGVVAGWWVGRKIEE